MKLTPGQSVALDLLRGLASLVVLVGHAWAVTKTPAAKYIEIQTLGVVIFFVLSGFLITYTCLIKTGYNFVEYSIDRFSRIYTSLIPALVLIYLIDWIGGQDLTTRQYSAETFVGNLLMLENNAGLLWYFGLDLIPRLGTNTPLWSIPIEWWLYMLFGVLFLPAGGRAGLVLKVIMAPIAIATFTYSTGHAGIGTAWLIGACAAVMFHFAPRANGSIGVGLAIVACAIIVTPFAFTGANATRILWSSPNMIMGVALATFAVLVFAQNLKLGLGSRRMIIHLALISYPLYLIHMPLQRAVYSYASPGTLAVSTAAIVMPLVAAVGFSFMFEIHHKWVRDWIKSTANRHIRPTISHR
ncbi:acyltransferase family protein [Nitratireductor soli]|uniref:acyltransferase family protein n=1 Tax=Nitratireductor soli TaxID=1670619 RepID=UPI0012FCB047|nr:acyltransferase [Nitratireductor soli]